METIKKFLYHPSFNVFLGIVGLIGVVFSIFAYFDSIREPNLTYYISSTRTPIVQKENLDNFSVTYHGILITNDFSAAEIQIWNKGKAPIHREDILRPITITLPNKEWIYGATATPSREVIGMGTDLSKFTNGIITVSWQILEANDGIKIQFMYGGNVMSPINVNGVIVGQKQGIHPTLDNIPTSKPLSLFCLTAGLMTVVGYTFLFRSMQKTTWVDSKSYVFSFLILCLGYIMGIALISFAIISHMQINSKPPFGF